MKKSRVVVIYDRKKKVAKTGKGFVELRIYLNHKECKFITMGEITPAVWDDGYASSPSVIAEIEKYESIIQAMLTLGTPLTIENLNNFLGKETEAKKEENAVTTKPGSFIAFMYDELHTEHIERRTTQAREVVYRSLLAFGRIKKFEDLTPANILEYHKWLQKDGNRKATTLKHYHKRLHRYVIKAFEYGYIDRDPYKSVKIPTGQYEEKQPLNESEINLLRSLRLPNKEEKARDLFIFSCFTGLCYCDAQAFDFKTMTEKKGDLYYIIGERIKTGTNFYTPILGPAMEILEKYNYRLPRMSNQKLNDYLHLVESRARLNKKLTSHLARHTFATWVLSHDVPVEDLARMLGHKDVRTTQHYAKILPTTIQRHAENLNNSIRKQPVRKKVRTAPQPQPQSNPQPQPQPVVVVQPVNTYTYSYDDQKIYINLFM